MDSLSVPKTPGRGRGRGEDVGADRR
jgi:hypothetical protein